jgi:hypothetical protein
MSCFCRSGSASSDDDNLTPPHASVREVCCRAGVLVDQIKFVYADGHEISWGSNGGQECEPFQLEKGEVIIGIEGTHREWNSNPGETLLGCFRISTSKNRSSPWYGKRLLTSDNIGNPNLGVISYTAKKKNPIIAVERIETGRCVHAWYVFYTGETLFQ